MKVPFAYDAPQSPAPQRPIAAVLHIFYVELTADMFDLLRNIPAPVHAYISTDTAAKRETILSAIGDWNRDAVTVRVLPNRGRDIPPKLIGFADIYANHDIVLFLHSKKETSQADGVTWRKLLYLTLAGSREITQSVLEIFDQHPRVGAIVPQHYIEVRHFIDWADTWKFSLSLATRMGIKVKQKRAIDFPSGSMFWVRSAALRPLLDLNLKYEDFPEESGQYSGTIGHAVERLFLIATEKAGYEWVKITAQEQNIKRGHVKTIHSREELADFVGSNQFRILHRHGNRSVQSI